MPELPFGSRDGDRIYVIGDIHGRLDLLDGIVEKIRCDVERHPHREGLAVTLGDYVDRGPDSQGVLDRLARNPFAIVARARPEWLEAVADEMGAVPTTLAAALQSYAR